MLINLRNAMMAGKRLPYDAEVEYLESSGTQWINTGITPTISDTTRIVADLSLTSINTGDNNIVLGSYAISPAVRQFAFVDTSAKARIAYVGASSGSATIAANSDYLFEAQFAPGNSYLKVNGATSSQNTSTATALPSWPLSLFACRYEDSVISPSSMRLHSCKIYLNGVLVRDYIPVRVGTVGYLYDRVSGKLFGNAGTGDFVLGQDVVPVEYLQSTGTQWINTGYIPNQQTRWELDYQFTSMGSGLNGMFQDNPTIRFNLGQGTDGFFNISYGANNPLSVTADTLRHLFVMDVPNLQWRIDSNNGAFPGAVTNTLQNSLRIFCRNSTGGRAFNLHSGRCFASRMYQSGALSQGLLPVRVGTEGAMMDTLTRRIYRNAGTGAFTYGNDLKYPIPAS